MLHGVQTDLRDQSGIHSFGEGEEGGILVSFTDSRGGGGGVTPIDSVVATATAFSQWSTVKAAQKGAVNGQSALKSMVNGRLQCGTDKRVHTKLNSNSLQLVTRELK